MRLAGVCVSIAVAALAAGVIAFTFADETTAPDSDVLARTVEPPAPSSTPSATPIPHTWLDAVGAMPFGRPPLLLTCLDRNGDTLLDATDDPLFSDVSLELSPEDACLNPVVHADYFEAAAPDGFGCGTDTQPVYLIVIGGGGSDLLNAAEGDSIGLTAVVRALLDRAAEARLSVVLTLSSGAVIGADMAQTSLEELIGAQLSTKLQALPCARAVLIGHSHGGVTVTSITAALEDRFAERILGVTIDRSNVLYDRHAENIPEATRIINVFQTNEGWHGEPLGRPNITDIDASSATAPIAPADGGGGPARVMHRSLDDSPAVQARIIEEIFNWLRAAE